MGWVLIAVAFAVALLATDHYNCKRRKRHALKWQLKRPVPLTAEEIDSWSPVWTLLVPNRFLKGTKYASQR